MTSPYICPNHLCKLMWRPLLILAQLALSVSLAAGTGNILPEHVNPDTLSVTSLPWVQQGQSYRSSGMDMALDAEGNIYVVGYFEQFLDLGAGQQWAKGESHNKGDIFLAKYDPMGNLQWMRTAGSEKDDQGIAIAINEDKVFITGYFSGICYFDKEMLLTKDRQNMFVAAYSHTGRLEWVKQAKSDGILRGQAIAADKEGHVYVTGNFRERVTFEGLTVSKQMNQNIFLLKLTSAGDPVWMEQAAGGNSLITYAYVYDIECDKNNNIVMAGEMVGPVRFGNTTYTTRQEWYADGPLPMREVFFAKYQPSGRLAWFQDVGVEVDFSDIAIDINNNILLTGHFLGSLEGTNKGRALLGKKSITTHFDLFGDCTEDIFVAKYTPEGDLIWESHFGGIAADRGQGVTADGKGNIYITGFFTDEMTFQNYHLTAREYRVASRDMFVARFSPSGDLMWIKTAGSTDEDEGKCIAADNEGNVYVSGNFEGKAAFGKNWVKSERYATFYLAKYNAVPLD